MERIAARSRRLLSRTLRLLTVATAIALCGSLLGVPARGGGASARAWAAGARSKHDNGPAKTSKPKRAGRPVVAGSAVDGGVLTAGDGTWRGTPPFTFSYQWSACIKRRKCSAIPNATQSTYRATTADIGKQLRVLVTASNSAGSASNSSLGSARVTGGPPVDLHAPSISGTPTYGQALTAEPGTWAGTPPFSFAYHWLSCQADGEACAEIAGADEPMYTVAASDTGRSLVVLVRAGAPDGSATADSQPLAVTTAAPKNTGLPSISGTASDGQQLTASTGTWSGTEPILYEYQWQRCNDAGGECSEIAGATLSTLTLDGEDIAHALRVTVTAGNIAGSQAATSEPSAVVGAVAPHEVVGPSILGLAIVGQTLTAVNGLWSGSEPISYAYQWERCNSSGEACVEIAGATKATYALTDEDATTTIRVVVTASNAGSSVPATSGASLQVTGVSPTNAALPSVTGTTTAGQVLSASSGTWSGTEPILYGYQWQLCNATGGECSNIFGAILSTLLLGQEDIGHTVRVTVTAANIAGSKTATSEASAVIKAIPPSDVIAPSVSGLTLVGQTLSAVNGLWSGSEPITYTYQWQRCNLLGETCANISSATKATYVLSTADASHTVRVVVTATNAGGSSKATSPASLITL